MRRFFFANTTFASRKAKDLKKAVRGRSLTDCQSALAAITGYSNWGELWTISHERTVRKSKHSPSPLDEDLNISEREARKKDQATVLAKFWGIPNTKAMDLIRKVRPTGRISQSLLQEEKLANYTFTVVGIQPLKVVATEVGKKELADAYMTGEYARIIAAQANVLTCAQQQGVDIAPNDKVGVLSTALLWCEPVNDAIGTVWAYAAGQDAFFRDLATNGVVTVPWYAFCGDDMPR